MLHTNIGAVAAFYAARQLERAAGRLRGKGFGSFSIDREVKLAIRAVGRLPELVLDVGGNVGEYAASVRKNAPQSQVVVFEPSASNVIKLRERFANDKLTRVVASGLSDTARPATLYADKQGSGAASLSKRRLEHFGATFDYQEPISLIALDQFWRDELRSGSIDIIKLDIEGHELSALAGATQALQNTAVVQFEFGGCNIDSRTFFQDFFYFFTGEGFDLYRITPLGVEAVVRYAEEAEAFTTTNFLAVRRAHRNDTAKV